MIWPAKQCLRCRVGPARSSWRNGGGPIPALRERERWYFLIVSTKSIRALKRAEARQRMADVRRARKSWGAAMAFERRYALTYGAKGRITNLREMLQAMAQ